MANGADREFPRLVSLEEVEEAGMVERTIEAGPDECAALARRFDLLGLTGLTADLVLRRVSGTPLVRVDGRLVAEVEQRCVVSLEPVAARIDERFTELFGPEGYELPEEAGEDDAPEVFESGGIDIGELAAQHLSLSLDPYPRAPGAELPAPRESSEDDRGAEPRRPFAELDQMLKKRR